MKYVVRLNVRAFNPVTRKIDARRMWEVEQCKTNDSPGVKWQCANVLLNGKSINELFVLPKEGEPPFEAVIHGIAVRGIGDAIEIREGRHDVG
jgi:hypothetical protein